MQNDECIVILWILQPANLNQHKLELSKILLLFHEIRRYNVTV